MSETSINTASPSTPTKRKSGLNNNEDYFYLKNVKDLENGGSRSRSQVNRFAQTAASDSPKTRGLDQKVGVPTLKEIPEILKSINNTIKTAEDREELVPIHNVIFGRSGKANENIKTNILGFTGFSNEEEKDKVSDRVYNKLNIDEFEFYFNLFLIKKPDSKDDYVDAMVEFLYNPQGTTRADPKELKKRKGDQIEKKEPKEKKESKEKKTTKKQKVEDKNKKKDESTDNGTSNDKKEKKDESTTNDIPSTDSTDSKKPIKKAPGKKSANKNEETSTSDSKDTTDDKTTTSKTDDKATNVEKPKAADKKKTTPAVKKATNKSNDVAPSNTATEKKDVVDEASSKVKKTTNVTAKKPATKSK